MGLPEFHASYTREISQSACQAARSRKTSLKQPEKPMQHNECLMRLQEEKLQSSQAHDVLTGSAFVRLSKPNFSFLKQIRDVTLEFKVWGFR
jgi:hypothetical protein